MGKSSVYLTKTVPAWKGNLLKLKKLFAFIEKYFNENCSNKKYTKVKNIYVANENIPKENITIIHFLIFFALEHFC